MATVHIHRTLCLALCLFVSTGRPLCAFDMFGFKVFEAHSDDEKPAVVAELRYRVEFSLATGATGLAEQLRQASLLIASEARGAVDIAALTARAKADRKRIISALYEMAAMAARSTS